MEKFFEVLTMESYSLHHLLFHSAIVFYLIILTGVFSFADMLYAVNTAKKLREPIRSHRFRKTVEKIALYWGAQLLIFMVGLMGTLFPWYNLPYLSMLAAMLICYIEGKSIVEKFKRRKDHMSKIPEAISEIVDYIGEEKVQRLIHSESAKPVLSVIVELLTKNKSSKKEVEVYENPN